MKKCYMCGIEKSVDDFLGDQSKSDGKSSRCKSCNRIHRKRPVAKAARNAAKKRWSKTEAGKAAIKRKQRKHRKTDSGKAAARARWKKKMETCPEKIRARSTVNKAIKAGTLTRLPCEVCGNQKSHAHHDDYSARLTVRFLCPLHHREHHDKISKKFLADQLQPKV